jgi:hypothetical protein
MIRDGLAEGEATDHFASRPWAADFARHAFEADPREFAWVLIEELLGSGAARRSGGRLVASAPHNRLPPDWHPAYPWPGNWPSTKAAEERPTGSAHKDQRNHHKGEG